MRQIKAKTNFLIIFHFVNRKKSIFYKIENFLYKFYLQRLDVLFYFQDFSELLMLVVVLGSISFRKYGHVSFKKFAAKIKITSKKKNCIYRKYQNKYKLGENAKSLSYVKKLVLRSESADWGLSCFQSRPGLDRLEGGSDMTKYTDWNL